MITDYLCLLRLNERHFSTCKVQKLWVWYRVFSFLFKTRISFYSWLHSMSQMNWIKGCKKLEQEKVNNLVLITIRGIGIHHKCDFERSLVSYFVPSLLAKSVRSTLFLWTDKPLLTKMISVPVDLPSFLEQWNGHPYNTYMGSSLKPITMQVVGLNQPFIYYLYYIINSLSRVGSCWRKDN